MAKIVGIDLGTTNSKDKKLFMRRFFLGSKFNSHNISNSNQCTSNQEQCSSNLGAIQYSVKLISTHSDDSQSNSIAANIANILKPNAFVNAIRSKLINPGPIKTSPNQPADRLPLIPESTRKNDFLTEFTLTKMRIDYNNFKGNN